MRSHLMVVGPLGLMTLALACGRGGDEEKASTEAARSASHQGETPQSAEPFACTHPFAGSNEAPANFDDDVIGRVDATDPTQAGKLVQDDPENPTYSSCSVPQPAPAIEQAGVAYHYQTHRFRNRTAATTCVSVSVIKEQPGGNPWRVAAYLGAFDPANIQAGYLGDGGFDSNVVNYFSFQVPAGSDFDIVVAGGAVGSAAADFGTGYRLSVGGCGGSTSADGGAATDAGASSDAGSDGGSSSGGSSGQTW